MPKYILNGATGDLDVMPGTENDPPTLGEKILNKGFKDIGIVMVTVFILSIVIFGMQIPKTIKELKR